MILAGIDEAGYGPLLGPLVVGCCAFETTVADGEEIPCLWSRLHRAVSKRKIPGGRKLHVNDSKAVYSPSTGVQELERGILAISQTLNGNCSDLNHLIHQTAAHALPDLAGYSWYQPSTDERFPLAQSAAAIGIAANALAVEMRKSQTHCVHLAARVMCERQLNAMFAATRNKASSLFSITAIHIDHLLRAFGHRDLVIVCDRQGGRQHYGSLLRLMFDEWSLEVVHEAPERSDYRLHNNGHAARILFMEKAEGFCMSVAAASMLGKYLREALMARFNAFWKIHVPLAAPTAGYYTDGLRFLRDIDPKRREMGIADTELVRSR
jgi:hypothetical protein